VSVPWWWQQGWDVQVYGAHSVVLMGGAVGISAAAGVTAAGD